MIQIKRIRLLGLLFIFLAASFIYAADTSSNGTTIQSAEASSIELLPFSSTNVDEWIVEKKAIKKNINKFLGSQPSYKMRLSSQKISEEDMGDYIRTKVSYKVDLNEVVTAYLLTPKNLTKPSPAILALHQTIKDGKDEVVGKTHNKEMSYGVDLVQQGFIVLAPDALTAGERIFPGYGAYESEPFYMKNPNWSMIGKAIWDNKIAIDYLMSLDIVDKDHIMVMGHSEGAVDSLFLAAFDERISAVALNCGLSTISGDPNPYRWSRDSWFIAFPKLKKYLDRGEIPFDFHQVLALIAPRPVLSLSASEDQVFPHYHGVFEIKKEVSKIYELYGKKDHLGIYVFGGEHSFPENNKIFVYNWLKEQID